MYLNLYIKLVPIIIHFENYYFYRIMSIYIVYSPNDVCYIMSVLKGYVIVILIRMANAADILCISSKYYKNLNYSMICR